MKIAELFRRESQLIVSAGQSWLQDGGSLMAAAVAYYAGLSFFPVILVLISSVGYFLELTNSGISAQEELVEAARSQFSASFAEQIDSVLEAVSAEAPANSLVGWLGLLLSAGVIFLQFDAAFDRIWGAGKSSATGWLNMAIGVVRQRLSSFLMLSSMGVFVVAVSIASFVLHTTRQWLPLPDIFWSLVAAITPIFVNLLAFTLLYRVVPKVKVRWREAFRGAVFATVLWEIGRLLIALLVLDGSYASAYQIVGSFIVVMLWVYYAAAVVFLGAEYIREFCRFCDSTESHGVNSTATTQLHAGSRVYDTSPTKETRSTISAR